MSPGIVPRKKLKLSDLAEDAERAKYQLQNLIDQVQNCQDGLDEIKVSEEREKSKVEEKYRHLKQMVYERRDGSLQKIPEFWVKCLKNHPRLSSLVDNKNSEWLRYLTKFRVEDADESNIAFKISFFFEENPFFENRVLTKEFTLEDGGEYASTNTGIKWYGSYYKQGLRRSKESRKRGPEEEGFMEWFQNNRNPSPELPGIMYFLWLKPLPFFLGKGEDDDADGLGMLLGSDDDDD